MSKVARVLYWFCTDLRLHDSPALQSVLDLKPAALFPVWCWDPNYVYKHRVGINRFRFLLESMTALSRSITSTQSNPQLLVVRGEPTELLPELWKRWNITHLVIEKDPSAYDRRRDKLILKAAKKNNVEVVAVQGHHLYDPEEVVKRNKGKPTMSMSTLQKIVADMGDVPKPIDAPKDLPLPTLKDFQAKSLSDTLSELAKSLEGLPHYTGKGREGLSSVDLNSTELGGQRNKKVTCYDTINGKASELFSVPTLASLGMDAQKIRDTIKGSEPLALEKLAKICKDAEYVATFAKPKTSPGQSAEDPSTTLMSPYLKFGCLSVRKFWWDVEEAKKKYKGGSKTGPPENFEWPVAVPRHNGDMILPRPAGDPVSEARLSAYKLGQTGFPWIDALMRQLRLEGWMHHLGRHSVAAFLTRGQCWISWERGAEIFDKYLIDWDPCSNPGNWMWLSCSAFFTQYFRLYGLATFPAKYDKTGALVRKYCPELAKFPDKYIYEPFNAPKDVQQKAGCIVGKDYPFPMLDEKETKGENMERMKICYQANLHGTSKEVLEGKADEMLGKKHGFKDAPKEFDWNNRPGAKIPDWAKAPKGEEHTTEGAPKGGNGASTKKDEDGEAESDGDDSDDVVYEREEEQKEECGDKKRKAPVKEENGKSKKKK
ncbi:hypothetical protein [Sporisorium scitamineum]|uniref:Photolyase/cryptochrome alpha/beta domain-containing protein n=1 Tax=Sporisorium scitamineum TaxID=49012 RepID=A0A0F7S563_9BASI|nr:hypothetical protein [Sporisorium scitamineum]